MKTLDQSGEILQQILGVFLVIAFFFTVLAVAYG